jgi:hypothetical protein
VFLFIFLLNLVFVILGSLGLLPLAAQITAVSLSSTAIGVMTIFNVISDISIIRRLFVAPGAYLYALTPVPRVKALAASVITMTLMDIVTMTVSIVGVTWLALMLSGNYFDYSSFVLNSSWLSMIDILFILVYIAMGVAGYLLVIMFILFCVTAKRSLFYQKPAGGLLTVLLALGTMYVFSLTPFLLVPFAYVSRWGLFFSITLSRTGQIMYTLLIIIQAATLFIITSRLMERKLNI